MGSQIKITSGPTIEHAADLAAILTNLNKNDVLNKNYLAKYSKLPSGKYTFVLNLIVVLISKYLLQSHYVALTFMINVSTVILPFVFAMLQYTISGVMFTLLANVYKKEISE